MNSKVEVVLPCTHSTAQHGLAQHRPRNVHRLDPDTLYLCVACPCICLFACRLDLLSKTLTWRHLAPTAPDTLTCYPFADDDPFVMQQCPHIMFAGNQPQFESRMMEGGSARKNTP